jgi:hypothetical protein
MTLPPIPAVAVPLATTDALPNGQRRDDRPPAECASQRR